MKKILTITATVVGAILCILAIVMPFDREVGVFAPATLFVGALLLFLPQMLIWRERERGAAVVAAALVGIALVLATALISAYSYAALYY